MNQNLTPNGRAQKTKRTFKLETGVAINIQATPERISLSPTIILL